MQIKREFETVTRASRRFIIRQSPIESGSSPCITCGEPMLAIAQAAVLLDIKQSRIFKIVERGAAHSTETESGALMICMSSLAAFSGGESQERSDAISGSEE
mgnify:CR=1